VSLFDPNRIEDGWEKLHKQTNRQTGKQTDRHYENNGHLAVKQFIFIFLFTCGVRRFGRCILIAAHVAGRDADCVTGCQQQQQQQLNRIFHSIVLSTAPAEVSGVASTSCEAVENYTKLFVARKTTRNNTRNTNNVRRGEATAQSRCQTLCSSTVNWKNINFLCFVASCT